MNQKEIAIAVIAELGTTGFDANKVASFSQTRFSFWP